MLGAGAPRTAFPRRPWERERHSTRKDMQSITINISNDKLATKVTWLLEHFKDDGLEIVSREDLDDLKLLAATRDEDSISFDDYLNNGD